MNYFDFGYLKLLYSESEIYDLLPISGNTYCSCTFIFCSLSQTLIKNKP